MQNQATSVEKELEIMFIVRYPFVAKIFLAVVLFVSP